MATETQISRPAPFVEDIGKDLSKQVLAQTTVPVVTTGLAGLGTMAQPTKQAFETADQFKQRQGLFQAQQRAALGFEQRQQALAGLAPQVAGLDPLQQQAQQRAVAGLGSFQPFLTQAQNLTGAGAGTGAGSIQEYMSPYQTQVIDASLAEFDRNAASNRQRIRDQAVASGAVGGGREGVELAEYQTSSDMDRAMLQANLLQQGFGQAQAARQQDFANQQGLAQLLPQLQRADISTLGSVGAVQQAQSQAEADATREAARQATFLPQENLSRYAGQVAGLMGGYPGQTTQSFVPNPSPLQTAIGAGSALAGIFGALK